MSCRNERFLYIQILLLGISFFLLQFNIAWASDDLFTPGQSGIAERADAEVTDLDYSKDFSVEVLAYIKPFEMQGRYASYISKGYESYNKWTIETGHEYYSSYGHSVSMGVQGASETVSLYFGNYAGYTHMVMTWDATSKTLSGYVNGSGSKKTSSNALLVSTEIESANPLQISGVYRSGWDPINADIGFARLWNRKLSDAEVDNIYNNWDTTAQHELPTGFDTTELLSEWLMNETSSATGTVGTTHIKDSVGNNHLELLNGASLQNGEGALATLSPADGTTGVGPSVFLTATGGPASLSDITGPMQYSFEIDEVSTFNSPELRQSEWLVHYSEWQPALKPGTTYYWRARVRNSSSTPETSSWTSSASFTTRNPKNWYVRNLTTAGTYGTENGSSYANAFNGLNNRINKSGVDISDTRGIVWGPGGVESGDTLYICGAHTVRHTSSLGFSESGKVYIPINGYSEEFPLTIRTDCPNETGIVYGFSKIYTAPYIWIGPDANGVYYTANNLATPLYADIGSPSAQFMLRENSTSWSGNLGYWYEIGGNTYVKMPDGGDPTGRISESYNGWQILAEHRKYIRFQNCDFRGYHFEDDRGTLGGLYPRSTHITWDNCTIQFGSKLIQLGLGNDYWTIQNSTLMNAGSAIYSLNNGEDFAGDYATIQNNTIRNLGAHENGYSDGDNHAVGAQGSSNWLIQNNYIQNVGSAIEFWNGLGVGRTMKNNVIRNNFIKDVNQFLTEGNGVVVSGSNGSSLGQRTGFEIYGNIIIDTEGHGISSNNPDTIMVYNNTIVHHGNGGTADGHGIREAITTSYPAAMTVKNNNLVNTANESINDINLNYFYHIFSSGSSSMSQVDIDYNNYYPDADVGNQFSVSIAGHKDLGEIRVETGLDTHSGSSSPLMASETPSEPEDVYLSAYSSNIDAGIDMGLTSDYFGNPIYGAPDIGAVEYQPPYRMNVDQVQTSGSVRVYNDGMFRELTASTTQVTAGLAVSPKSGWSTTNFDHYMDVTIDTWTGDLKTWIASSTIATTSVFTITGLDSNRMYIVTVDGTPSASIVGACADGTCQSDGSGVLTIEYTGSWSTHTFTLMTGEYVSSNNVSGSGGGSCMNCDVVKKRDSEPFNSGSNSSGQLATSSVKETTELTLFELIDLLAALGIIPPEKLQLARTTVEMILDDHNNTTNIIDKSFRFTVPLKQGDDQSEVKFLQMFLNSQGFLLAEAGPGSHGNETTYFGERTKNAVMLFQEMYREDILTSQGIANSTGIFHMSSIRKANQLLQK